MASKSPTEYPQKNPLPILDCIRLFDEFDGCLSHCFGCFDFSHFSGQSPIHGTSTIPTIPKL
jgi:hypothetical protein